MSDRIKLLPEVVANQIAAGEVVNRPSSVIKEMMENSIDAGAQYIIVNFREGGGDLIQIVDDGCGMSPNDARIAFDRHATSKISSSEDLYDLHTFGFRGEALASIAAVSQVELRTRQVDDQMGTSTIVNGGEFVAQEPIMCEVGSQFLVRNLFYNVPARRKFMDRVTTSTSQIKADFKRIALCNPDIHFELKANDAPLFNLPPGSLASRIVDVVGRSIKQNLLEIKAKTSIVKIKGYIGRPAAAKKSNNEQYLFVNGRFFRSPYFTKAILKGYEKLIPATSTPSYFLYFEIDPERIDVNVHPQKIEVKFADNDAIWQIIVAAVRETLAKTGAVPMMDFDDESPIDIPILRAEQQVRTPSSFSEGEYNPFSEGYIDPKAPDPNVDFTGFDVPYNIGDEATPRRKSELKEGAYASMVDSFGLETIPSQGFVADQFDQFESIPSMAGVGVESGGSQFELVESMVTIEDGVLPSQPLSSSFDFVESSSEPQQRRFTTPVAPIEVRSVTPLGGGYAFAMVGTESIILDIARAKERVLFDHFISLIGGAPSVSQQLLFPERLVFSLDEYSTMEESAVDFAVLGFDIEFMGGGAVDVKGIPPEIKRDEIDTLIYKLLSVVSNPESVEEVRRQNIARVVARNGVAAATVRGLSPEQIEQLIVQLFEGGNTALSPSGKPILWCISQAEIAERLK